MDRLHAFTSEPYRLPPLSEYTVTAVILDRSLLPKVEFWEWMDTQSADVGTWHDYDNKTLYAYSDSGKTELPPPGVQPVLHEEVVAEGWVIVWDYPPVDP
jgi:hypothetical protein